MIGMIAACTQNGVIGLNDRLPFDHKEDMKHFRITTANSVVIMGRTTFQGIGRALPKRRNIVISKIAKGLGIIKEDAGIEIAGSIQEAISMCSKETRDIWLIGGARVYQEGMEYADKILLTLTSDIELEKNVVRFPFINPDQFDLKSIVPLVPEDKDCKLQLATYIKNKWRKEHELTHRQFEKTIC